jgi:putative pyruvate formate lyase activating enzyme
MLPLSNDKLAKKSLARYFAIVRNKKPAKFLVAKKLSAEFSKDDSIDELWAIHIRCIEDLARIEQEIDEGTVFPEIHTPEKSFFDLKIEIAGRILQVCHFCSRRCKVDRSKGEVGYCSCGDSMEVSSIFGHLGEEPELVPSGTIFTLGCNLRCCFCQNWTISQWVETGTKLKPEDLAVNVARLRLEGCRNVNLVGGEPTPWILQWLITFKYVSENLPIVWNSNSYYSPETAELLAGFADVYLLDFKYGPGNCAQRISSAPDYWSTCTENHSKAKKNGELIIRVLVLPNHLDCCTKATLNWIAENLGYETRVNLMFQYRPEWRASTLPELDRRLTEKERKKAIEIAQESGLTNFIK